jgi:hypothetical protein
MAPPSTKWRCQLTDYSYHLIRHEDVRGDKKRLALPCNHAESVRRRHGFENMTTSPFSHWLCDEIYLESTSTCADIPSEYATGAHAQVKLEVPCDNSRRFSGPGIQVKMSGNCCIADH